MKSHQVVKSPFLTEKSNRGKGHNRVSFEVHPCANKIEISNAISSLFGVEVLAVHTMNVRGKEKRQGRFSGRRANWKKAIVTLSPSSKIEYYEGV